MIENENSKIEKKRYRELFILLAMSMLGLAGMATILLRVILTPRQQTGKLAITVIVTQNRELPAIWILLDGMPVILSTGGGDASRGLVEDMHRNGYWHAEAIYAPGNLQGIKAMERITAELDCGYAAYFGHYRSNQNLDAQAEQLRSIGIMVASLSALPGPRWHDRKPLWEIEFSRKKPDNWYWEAQFGVLQLSVRSYGEDGILEITGKRDKNTVFLERLPRCSNLKFHRWEL